MTSFWSDLVIQGAMIGLAVVFAALVSRRAGGSLKFTTALLQAVTAEAAFVVLISLIVPSVFKSNDNRNAFVALIAMMVLIYALRDIFENVGHWRRRSGPAESDTRKHV